jgi:hypothetical protein
LADPRGADEALAVRVLLYRAQDAQHLLPGLRIEVRAQEPQAARPIFVYETAKLSFERPAPRLEGSHGERVYGTVDEWDALKP